MATKFTQVSGRAPKPFAAIYAAFKDATVHCSDRKVRPMGAIHLSLSNLYETAFAIVAWCDLLGTKTHLARDRLLLEAFTGVKVTVEDRKTVTERTVSIKKMAEKVLELYKDYYEMEFLDSTLCRNHRATRNTSPFGTEDDARTSLGQAGLTALVRAFTFYLEHTVRNMFERRLDVSEWVSSAATYTLGFGDERVSRSSADFSVFAEALLDLYDDLCLLSSDCSEFEALEAAALKAGETETAARAENRPRRNQPLVSPPTQRRIAVRTTATAAATAPPVVRTRPATNRFGALQLEEEAEEEAEKEAETGAQAATL